MKYNKVRLLELTTQSERIESFPKLKRWSLNFVDPDFELAYMRHLWQIRRNTTALGVGVVLFTFIMGYALDIYDPNENFAAMITMRSAAVVLGAVVLLICLICKCKKRIYFLPYMMLVYLGIVAVCDASLWGFHPKLGALPFMGYTVLLVCTFGVSNLRFPQAAAEGVIICIVYNVAVGIRESHELTRSNEEMRVFAWVFWDIYSSFLLFLLGVGCYVNEKNIRKDWFSRIQALDREIQLLHAKQSEEISNAKTRFIANISHELRTPLHGIIGMAGCLQETSLTWDQKEYTNIIQRSADALVSLTNDILDTAKIEKQGEGTLTVKMIPFSLLKVVEDSFDILAKLATEKGLDLAHQLQRDIPKILVSDPCRIRQLILNLVKNAIKFTDAGVIHLTACVVDQGASKLLQINVKDTGRGISDDKIGELFKPFAQLGDTVVSEGAGLGLYISKIIVGQLGGSIGVKSAEQKGSDFWFKIPLVPDPTSPPNLFECVAPPGKRIALFHSPGIAKGCLEHYLTQRGHSVENVDNLEQLCHVNAMVIECKQDFMGFTKELKSKLPHLKLIFLCKQGTNFAYGTKGNTCLVSNIEGTPLHCPVKPEQLFRCLEAEDHKLEIPPPLAAPVGIKVLLVEDNLVNQKVASNILSKQQCQIATALNGQEAVEKAQGEHFDLILMDWQMPVMDGIEATKKIRQFNKTVSIIAVTAAANKQKECLEAGATDFLIKPFKPSQLRDLLSKYAGKQQTNYNQLCNDPLLSNSV